jgi:chemotaxis protein methyltransferase CheR
VTAVASRREVERFRAAVTQRLGLAFDEAKSAFLGEVLERRLAAAGGPAACYLTRLENGCGRGELGALARELTVGETYLFRNSEQFRAVAEIALPRRLRAARTTRLLRLVSAGCASGEEPYSLAIICREVIADPAWTVQIRGVDINPSALARAAEARFSAWALRETPAEVRARWFRPAGSALTLDPAVRDTVAFEQRNLADDDPELWAEQQLDIVFCRNVLMYFAPEQARALVARIAAALAPGGYLFLGHAENLRGLSDAFHLRHTHNTFYYERKTEGRVVALPRPAAPGTAWIDAIAAASQRVAALCPAPAAPEPEEAAPWDAAGALDLLRADRFPEALALVRARPAQSARDPDLILLEAVLLAHRGERDAAEDCCKRLLAVDGLNAGAHYALALCRESAGDGIAAAEHDRIAIHLDPGFAMPHLHLGLLARRGGEREAARRELVQALALLRREDASRLLLFGGGFGREALIGLCESALRDCGGQA